jgi:hypothetical protein
MLTNVTVMLFTAEVIEYGPEEKSVPWPFADPLTVHVPDLHFPRVTVSVVLDPVLPWNVTD